VACKFCGPLPGVRVGDTVAQGSGPWLFTAMRVESCACCEGKTGRYGAITAGVYAVQAMW